MNTNTRGTQKLINVKLSGAKGTPTPQSSTNPGAGWPSKIDGKLSGGGRTTAAPKQSQKR